MIGGCLTGSGTARCSVVPGSAAIVALLLVLAIPLFTALLPHRAGAQAQQEVMTAADAWHGARNGTLFIIDVRTPAEWRSTGIPPGAGLVDFNGPGGRAGFLERVRSLGLDPANDRVALICASGARSARAASWLDRAGYRHVYSVREGMLGRSRLTEPRQPGWLARGLPTAPWPANSSSLKP